MKRHAGIAIVAATLACGSDGPTRPLPDVTGSWTLIALNGVSLPATLQEANPRLDIVSEKLVISSDRTFQQLRMLHSTDAGTPSNISSVQVGTYDPYVMLTVLHFTNFGYSGTATVSGDTMTVDAPNNAFVYKVEGNTLTVAPANNSYVYVRK